MYLIDTDVLIWALRDNPKYLNLLERLAKKEPVSLSVITIAEIYRNIFPSEIVKTEEFLSTMEIIDVNPNIAKQAGFYWQQYSKQLKNLSLADCLIAATATSNKATLVSLNKKHFPMKDIQLLDI